MQTGRDHDPSDPPEVGDIQMPVHWHHRAPRKKVGAQAIQHPEAACFQQRRGGRLWLAEACIASLVPGFRSPKAGLLPAPWR